ncbi:hypothetical protein Tco_1371216 [Tanacetum coccineum]
MAYQSVEGWSSKGASASDGAKYSGYSGSGDGGATGYMGSPSYPYIMTRGGPLSDGSLSAPQKTLPGSESV